MEIQIRTHECTSVPSSVSRRTGSTSRRAQGGRRRPPRPPTTRTWRGSPTSPTGRPRRAIRASSRFAPLRDRRQGDVRLHPQGKVIGCPPVRPGRLRLRGPHRDRAPHDGCQGETGASSRSRATLSSGDVVEIFTSKNPDSGPSQDWLTFVRSPVPQQDQAVVHQGTPREAIEQGRDAIARAMRKQNLPLQRIMSQDSIAEVASSMRLRRRLRALRGGGRGHVSTQSVIEKVLGNVQTEAETDEPELAFPRTGHEPPQLRNSDSGVLVRGAPDILVKLAKCCTPVPATRSWASSPAVRASPCTRRRART